MAFFQQLLGNDNSRSFKWTDENSNDVWQENDIATIRFAEVILARAEALNEINGPTQESIDLINMVRARAKIPNLSLGAFTKESLRDHILQERNWEFFSEGKRRDDLLRHGKFISSAQDRGKPAQEFHKLYPIPSVEITANPNLAQNPGY